MKYEAKLEIPKKLYHNGVPHTLHIWPSMFSGKIVRNKKLDEIKTELWRPRRRVRNWLVDHGIKWSRNGLKIQTYQPKEIGSPLAYQPKWQVYQPEIETLFKRHNSYIWNIPGVSPSFIMGGTEHHYKQRYQTWKILARALPSYNMDIGAIYTAYIDWLGHWMSPLKLQYYEVFDLARTLGKRLPVMLVSDHGCLDGNHTQHAYLGCTEPIEAKNVVDVRDDIVQILVN